MSCLYDVIDDVILGEGSSPSCTASYWSVLFTEMHHICVILKRGVNFQIVLTDILTIVLSYEQFSITDNSSKAVCKVHM